MGGGAILINLPYGQNQDVPSLHRPHQGFFNIFHQSMIYAQHAYMFAHSLACMLMLNMLTCWNSLESSLPPWVLMCMHNKIYIWWSPYMLTYCTVHSWPSTGKGTHRIGALGERAGQTVQCLQKKARDNRKLVDFLIAIGFANTVSRKTAETLQN